MENGLGPHPVRSALLRVLAALGVIALALVARETVLAEGEDRSERAGSRLVELTVPSSLLGEELPVSVVVPPGARDGNRALLLFLHGRGGDETSYLDAGMYAGLVAQGGRAPIVAFPRGGPDSYWHDREQGSWGSYVTRELLPRLVRRFGVNPDRVAIGGISMGGSGAFSIAARRPGRFCTLGGHSPAVWVDGASPAPGAFDDEAAFKRNNPIRRVGPPRSPLAGKVVWLDVGGEDPFLEANEALERALTEGGARVGMRIWPGGHEDSYWAAHWRRYMRFYATQLKRCGKPGNEGADRREQAGGAG